MKKLSIILLTSVAFFASSNIALSMEIDKEITVENQTTASEGDERQKSKINEKLLKDFLLDSLLKSNEKGFLEAKWKTVLSVLDGLKKSDIEVAVQKAEGSLKIVLGLLAQDIERCEKLAKQGADELEKTLDKKETVKEDQERSKRLLQIVFKSAFEDLWEKSIKKHPLFKAMIDCGRKTFAEGLYEKGNEKLRERVGDLIAELIEKFHKKGYITKETVEGICCSLIRSVVSDVKAIAKAFTSIFRRKTAEEKLVKEIVKKAIKPFGLSFIKLIWKAAMTKEEKPEAIDSETFREEVLKIDFIKKYFGEERIEEFQETLPEDFETKSKELETKFQKNFEDWIFNELIKEKSQEDLEKIITAFWEKTIVKLEALCDSLLKVEDK